MVLRWLLVFALVLGSLTAGRSFTARPDLAASPAGLPCTCCDHACTCEADLAPCCACDNRPAPGPPTPPSAPSNQDSLARFVHWLARHDPCPTLSDGPIDIAMAPSRSVLRIRLSLAAPSRVDLPRLCAWLT